MPTKFDDYLREIEEKIEAEGPEAVARWEVFNTHFAMAREVRELRKERRLTQKQLAAASGISQAKISRIEPWSDRPDRSHTISDQDLRTVEDELYPMAELPDVWKVGDDGSPAPNWVAALHRSRRDH
jgi:DNA-binding transcriptional regulator YiaG